MLDKTAEKFWNKVDRRGDDECWEWTAGKTGAGYGAFYYNRKQVLASRVAWELEHGPVPSGEHYGTTCVCHICDNPGCCNPNHLFLGTHSENMIDMYKKGRGVDHAGERGGSSKLTNEDVAWIRMWLGLGYLQKVIAGAFNVSESCIYSVSTGLSWSHI